MQKQVISGRVTKRHSIGISRTTLPAAMTKSSKKILRGFEIFDDYITMPCGKLKVLRLAAEWSSRAVLASAAIGSVAIPVLFNQQCPGKTRQKKPANINVGSRLGSVYCLDVTLPICDYSLIRGSKASLCQLFQAISIPSIWLPSIVAGAMENPTTTLSSQLLSTTDRRSKRTAVSEEPAKKPKKPNSEIRKQQNRIASRNYRMSTRRLVTTCDNI
jgi:hypothetical protein